MSKKNIIFARLQLDKKMKRFFVYISCAALLLTGCGTYTGSGAFTGAHFGSILGSAIGGISGGPRGSDVGTIIGMAGGAVVGAAIGSAHDEANRREVHERYEQVQRNKRQRQQDYPDRRYDDDYGYYDPTGSGDDRLYDFNGSDYTGDYSASSARVMSPGASSIEEISSGYSVNNKIEVRNPRFVDDNRDGYINSNEVSKVIFEVYNNSDQMLYDLQPIVVESSGVKNLYISPSIHVEHLAPGKGIRYTAMVKTGRMKDGNATFCISVLQGNRVMSNVTEFTVRTIR